MAAKCVNIQHPYVTLLAESLNMPKEVIGAYISLWQDKNNTDAFPSVSALASYIFTTLSPERARMLLSLMNTVTADAEVNTISENQETGELHTSFDVAKSLSAFDKFLRALDNIIVLGERASKAIERLYRIPGYAMINLHGVPLFVIKKFVDAVVEGLRATKKLSKAIRDAYIETKLSEYGISLRLAKVIATSIQKGVVVVEPGNVAEIIDTTEFVQLLIKAITSPLGLHHFNISMLLNGFVVGDDIFDLLERLYEASKDSNTLRRRAFVKYLLDIHKAVLFAHSMIAYVQMSDKSNKESVKDAIDKYRSYVEGSDNSFIKNIFSMVVLTAKTRRQLVNTLFEELKRTGQGISQNPSVSDMKYLMEALKNKKFPEKLRNAIYKLVVNRYNEEAFASSVIIRAVVLMKSYEEYDYDIGEEFFKNLINDIESAIAMCEFAKSNKDAIMDMMYITMIANDLGYQDFLNIIKQAGYLYLLRNKYGNILYKKLRRILKLMEEGEIPEIKTVDELENALETIEVVKKNIRKTTKKPEKEDNIKRMTSIKTTLSEVMDAFEAKVILRAQTTSDAPLLTTRAGTLTKNDIINIIRSNYNRLEAEDIIKAYENLIELSENIDKAIADIELWGDKIRISNKDVAQFILNSRLFIYNENLLSVPFITSIKALVNAVNYIGDAVRSLGFKGGVPVKIFTDIPFTQRGGSLLNIFSMTNIDLMVRAVVAGSENTILAISKMLGIQSILTAINKADKKQYEFAVRVQQMKMKYIKNGTDIYGYVESAYLNAVKLLYQYSPTYGYSESEYIKAVKNELLKISKVYQKNTLVSTPFAAVANLLTKYESIDEALEGIRQINPDYISVVDELVSVFEETRADVYNFRIGFLGDYEVVETYKGYLPLITISIDIKNEQPTTPTILSSFLSMSELKILRESGNLRHNREVVVGKSDRIHSPTFMTAIEKAYSDMINDLYLTEAYNEFMFIMNNTSVLEFLNEREFQTKPAEEAQNFINRLRRYFIETTKKDLKVRSSNTEFLYPIIADIQSKVLPMEMLFAKIYRTISSILLVKNPTSQFTAQLLTDIVSTVFYILSKSILTGRMQDIITANIANAIYTALTTDVLKHEVIRQLAFTIRDRRAIEKKFSTVSQGSSALSEVVIKSLDPRFRKLSNPTAPNDFVDIVVSSLRKAKSAANEASKTLEYVTIVKSDYYAAATIVMMLSLYYMSLNKIKKPIKQFLDELLTNESELVNFIEFINTSQRTSQGANVSSDLSLQFKLLSQNQSPVVRILVASATMLQKTQISKISRVMQYIGAGIRDFVAMMDSEYNTYEAYEGVAESISRVLQYFISGFVWSASKILSENAVRAALLFSVVGLMMALENMGGDEDEEKGMTDEEKEMTLIKKLLSSLLKGLDDRDRDVIMEQIGIKRRLVQGMYDSAVPIANANMILALMVDYLSYVFLKRRMGDEMKKVFDFDTYLKTNKSTFVNYTALAAQNDVIVSNEVIKSVMPNAINAISSHISDAYRWGSLALSGEATMYGRDVYLLDENDKAIAGLIFLGKLAAATSETRSVYIVLNALTYEFQRNAKDFVARNIADLVHYRMRNPDLKEENEQWLREVEENMIKKGIEESIVLDYAKKIKQMYSQNKIVARIIADNKAYFKNMVQKVNTPNGEVAAVVDFVDAYNRLTTDEEKETFTTGVYTVLSGIDYITNSKGTDSKTLRFLYLLNDSYVKDEQTNKYKYKK